MKKLLRSLLAVMLIAMMALSFTSCAKPEKVEDKLKDMDYEVELIDDEDDIEDMGDLVPIDPDDEPIDSFIANADFVDEEDVQSFDLMDETPASEADIIDDYIDNEMEV